MFTANPAYKLQPLNLGFGVEGTVHFLSGSGGGGGGGFDG